MKLSAYQEHYSVEGPIATVYLDVSRDNENGETELDLRWRALKDELTEAGAADEAVSLLEPVIMAPTGLPGAWGRVVAATKERVLLDRVIPGRIGAHASWDAFPHLVPLVAAEAWAVPHIFVEIDRVGADITVSAAAGEWSETIEGDDQHIRKVNVGGWAHLRYLHRAENLWDANAKSVAERLDRLVSQLRPEVIVVAGDIRAMQLLRDNMHETTRPLLRQLDTGGRNAGENESLEQEALQGVLEETARERARGYVERFLEEHGRGERATAGLTATVEALRRAQVDTLLVPPDWDDHRPAWFGPEPMVLALEPAELSALGVDDPREAPLADVVLNAAIGTDAEVVVIPEDLLALDGQPAALLRFSDASTHHESAEVPT